MGQTREIFDVTRAQLEEWADGNWDRFSYDLIPDTQLLLVSCSRGDSGWEVYANSDSRAVESADAYDECGLDNVAEGYYQCIEHEVWRVVDLPVDGEAYEVPAYTLRGLEAVATRLEDIVCASCGIWDIKKLVTCSGEPAWGVMTREEESVLGAAIHLRRFVSSTVAHRA